MTIVDMIEPFYSANGLFVGSIFYFMAYILKNLFKVINSNVYIALLLFVISKFTYTIHLINKFKLQNEMKYWNSSV